jgi:hypothetical protein
MQKLYSVTRLSKMSGSWGHLTAGTGRELPQDTCGRDVVGIAASPKTRRFFLKTPKGVILHKETNRTLEEVLDKQRKKHGYSTGYSGRLLLDTTVKGVIN